MGAVIRRRGATTAAHLFMDAAEAEKKSGKGEDLLEHRG